MNVMTKDELLKKTNEAACLLREMVRIDSLSGNESDVCDVLISFLESRGHIPLRLCNNIVLESCNAGIDAPVLMLNSHMDTVSPCKGYSYDPFDPGSDDAVVRGLGSNDAGASVVSLIETFLHFSSVELPFNITLLISAEEENSGKKGISLALKQCGRVDAAIVGEPTQMKGAIAERGLLVIDAIARGKAGHAAREEGVNALYIALDDIQLLRDYRFDRHSELMGDVKMTATQIQAGDLHNVVPDKCSFILDIRPTDMYTNREITDIVSSLVKSELIPRNLNNKSSATPYGHPLIVALERSGTTSFVSPTTSDWMRLECPAVKMGPGDSSRSHRPDEFILVSEIKSGIEGYINFINCLEL